MLQLRSGNPELPFYCSISNEKGPTGPIKPLILSAMVAAMSEDARRCSEQCLGEQLQ